MNTNPSTSSPLTSIPTATVNSATPALHTTIAATSPAPGVTVTIMPPVPSRWYWLTLPTWLQASPSEERAITVTLTLLSLMLTWHTYAARASRGNEELTNLPRREFQLLIDINQANAMELMHLPGIGPTLANRILTDREQHGPFASWRDLERVRGIGPKTRAKMEPYLAPIAPTASQPATAPVSRQRLSQERGD